MASPVRYFPSRVPKCRKRPDAPTGRNAFLPNSFKWPRLGFRLATLNSPEESPETESTLRSGASKAVSDVTIVATVGDYMAAPANAATRCGCGLAVATGHDIEFIDRKFVDASMSFGHCRLSIDLTSGSFGLA
jgi:hypothetical protein